MVDSDLLRTFGADFPALQLSSAIAFLIAAAALDSAQGGGARAARRARVGAAAVAVIAALMLAGHALGIRAGLDLAFLGLGRSGTHVPVLMPVASALALELVAAAIVVATCRGPWTEVANRVAAAALLGIALLAIVGLSFRLLLAYGAAPLFGMAVPDAIAFLLIGVSLLAGRPDAWLADLVTAERPGAVMSRWLLPAAIVVPILAHLAQLFAQQVGVVDEPLGQGLLVLLTVAGLGALTLWIGHALDRMNARRVRAERAMRAAYDELDARVVERTAASSVRPPRCASAIALLATITGSTPDLIFAKDIAGRLLMVNPAYSPPSAAAEVDVIGRTSLELATDLEAGRAKADHDRFVVESGRSLTWRRSSPARRAADLSHDQVAAARRGGAARRAGRRRHRHHRAQAARERELEKLVVAEQRLRARPSAPTAPRTSSSPSSRTSCARRSTRCAAGAICWPARGRSSRRSSSAPPRRSSATSTTRRG